MWLLYGCLRIKKEQVRLKVSFTQILLCFGNRWGQLAEVIHGRKDKWYVKGNIVFKSFQWDYTYFTIVHFNCTTKNCFADVSCKWNQLYILMWVVFLMTFAPCILFAQKFLFLAWTRCFYVLIVTDENSL